MQGQPNVDARPILPVSLDSLWDRAASRRDRIAQVIGDELAQRGMKAWVGKSKPGEYPPYVTVNSWVQRGETDLASTFDRSSLKVEIQVDPYRESPLIYRVLLARHSRAFDKSDWTLDDAEVRECAAYLIDGGRKPRFFRPRLPLVLRVIGAFLPFGPFVRSNKLIRDARRSWESWFTWPLALFVLGALAALFAHSALYEGGGDDTFALALAALVAAGFWTGAYHLASRRPMLDSIPKQPMRTPRQEFRIDSWHVSVPGAGKDFQAFRKRLIRCMQPPEGSNISLSVEVHENLTPRGFEERKRVVLGKGQALLHVHIYPYADDAFVGWESYLNWNRWAEGGVVASTIHNGTSVKFRALNVGVHVPTDFDLIEADVLSETTHRKLVNEIKLFLKEAEIEADIDFTIIRGDRRAALDKSGKADAATKKSAAAGKPKVAYY